MLRTAKGEVLAARVVVAGTFLTRLRGLLGLGALPEGFALLLRPCNQVHTFFMRFAIGAVFLDEAGRVLDKQLLRPWQISHLVKSAAAVVEIAPLVLERVETGEVLVLQNN